MTKTMGRTNRHRMRLAPDIEAGLQPAESGEWNEFLRDPIAYGQFDWGDPIELEEFNTSRHYRGRYVAPLAF